MSNKKKGLVKLARTFRVSRDTTDTFVHQYLEALDTPKSLAVWLMYKENEHAQLLELCVEPRMYLHYDAFRRDLCAVSLLEKANFLSLGRDLRAEALKKFHDSERCCAATNQRLKSSRMYNDEKTSLYASLLFRARQKIYAILPDDDLSSCLERNGWGPGATFHIRGTNTSASNKFSVERGITRDLYPLHESISLDLWPLWSCSSTHVEEPDFAVGGYLTTVPKNAKSDRVIAIEPGINSWYQKGIGSFLRSRLRRWGIDLDSQLHNQLGALRGSLDGSLATVDFKAASDTISTEVVRELLPPRWFNYLNLCRSKFVTIDGLVTPLEKFSSMGNGYTFELETLIFASAAKAVCDHLGISDSQVLVYGDDVIVPVEAYPLYNEFCSYLGFTINSDKTHVDGYYRESCGSHYFNGVDVKPIFLKERIVNVETVYKLANAVRRLAHRYNFNCSCDSRFHRVWSDLVYRVPQPLRLMVPDHLGDVGLVSNWDEATPPKARHQLEGWVVRRLQRRPVTVFDDRPGHLVSMIFGLENRLDTEIPSDGDSRPIGNNVSLRRVTSLHVGISIVPKWYDFGQWISI
ncbi:MAG: RNA replicase beta chain [Sanya fiers-like virus 20]|nr:MAG: RNA replicase beta chain [Sanya fiers-like virus 20]